MSTFNSLCLYVLVCCLSTLLPTRVKAQDTLILGNGSELFVKVVEIGDKTISYKKHENPNGPIYTIDQSRVFLVFYKGGRRESFTAASSQPEAPKDEVLTNQVSSEDASIEEGSFTLQLLDIKPIPNKAFNIITATIAVRSNGLKFSNVTVTAYQSKKVTLDFSSPNKFYYWRSHIDVVVEDPKIRRFLFDKYENESGKGYGWALPPHFFSLDAGTCSVAFLQLKTDNRDLSSYSKVSPTKMDLKDCTSFEHKLLSFALLWLQTNFIKQ